MLVDAAGEKVNTTGAPCWEETPVLHVTKPSLQYTLMGFVLFLSSHF